MNQQSIEGDRFRVEGIRYRLDYSTLILLVSVTVLEMRSIELKKVGLSRFSRGEEERGEVKSVEEDQVEGPEVPSRLSLFLAVSRVESS